MSIAGPSTPDADTLFYVVGNGPSLKTGVLDALPAKRWIGMNAAYKYWDKTGRYPHYYSCLDPVVVVQHADAIRRMMDAGEIAEFFLHEAILTALPDLREHPKVTLRDDFMAQDSTIPVSPLSHYKQTTGVLATRFCIERGHRNLCLLGIDCNYVEQISQSQTGQGYELVIKGDVRRNPNYFFDNYQEKNERYQVPNPEVHSGNLHLQSFIALRHDITSCDVDIDISVGSRESLLSRFNIFPYFDAGSALRQRRLNAIAVPLMPHELDGFLERLDYWIDPKLLPSLGVIDSVALHIFMSCAERPEVREKIEAAFGRVPWLSEHFCDLRVTFLNIDPVADYYVKGTSLNVFCNKSGPNIFWLMIMAACRRYQFTFLMEADCVPVRPGWLDALEQATRDCPIGTWTIGASYFGPTMVAPINGFHINGNAIYATGDRSFQDFLGGDFIKALQWMAEQVSNSVAYDVAFALGIQNYQDILSHTGIDLRKYVWRYSFTPVIRNISGQAETEGTHPVDIMSEVRSDVSMFICHGQPALRWLKDQFRALDSFYLEDAKILRETRLHGIGSRSKFVAWKYKGYGIVDAELHTSQKSWPTEMRINVGAIIENSLGGRLELRLEGSKGLLLTGVDAIGHLKAKGKATLDFTLVTNDESVELQLGPDTCDGTIQEIGIELTFTYSPKDEKDAPQISGLRMLHYPATDKTPALEICPKDEVIIAVESTWTDWIRRGQAELDTLYRFIECAQPIAMPTLREVTSSPKARFEQGLMQLPLDGNATARLWFKIKPRPGAAPDVHLSLQVIANVDCDLIVGGKAFGFSVVEEKQRLKAGKRISIGLRFQLAPSKGNDIFISFNASPVKTTTSVEAPTLSIEKISVLKTPQFSDDSGLAVCSRIVSVNPDAESFFGHFLNYEARLGRALTGQGLPHVIAGPVDAGADVYAAHPEMEKVFTGRTNTLYAKDPGTPVPGLAAFEAELDAYLGTLKHDDATLLFMYCGSLEIAEVFARLADKYPACSFAISLYYLSWLDLGARDIVAYWTPRLRALAAHPRIRLIVPSPELAGELQTGFGVFPEILPHPTTTFHDHEIGCLEGGRRKEGDKRLTVVFPGNQRGGKGYELTAEAIVSLLETEGDNVRIRVRFPPDDSLNKARRAFFDSIRDRVEIMDSYLDETEFRDLLLSADLVALPYTADRFANRTSGLLIDSLLLGIPCVVIEKTWLASTISEYGFGFASPEDGRAFAGKISDALKRIAPLKAAAIAARDRYLKSNSWNALVDFLARPSQARAAPLSTTSSVNATTAKENPVKKRLLLIGNGPSARLLAEAGFDKIPADMDSFGTTAAYRYFERVGWWPTYYALADRKVVFHHRENFARLLEDPKVTTKKFFLSWRVSDSDRMELIPHSSTGSFCLKKAVELGYDEIYLIGMEGAYVEEILESRPLTPAEISDRGFGVLNLSRAESKLRILDRTPSYNPNYFFAGYQQEGDVYSLPQAHTHQANWDGVKAVAKEAGARVVNLSRISKIDAFERGDIRDVFDFLPVDCWENMSDPFSDKAKHVKSHFSITTGSAFGKRTDTEWHYAPTSKDPGAFRAIFEHVGITRGRSLVGGVRLTANRPIRVDIGLGRHGPGRYEGTGNIVTLEPGVATDIDMQVEFREQYKAIKLQIGSIDLMGASEVDLRIEDIYLTETIDSVVERHDASELSEARARRAEQEGEYSFAMAVHLHLARTAASDTALKDAARVATKLGIGPRRAAGLGPRLINARAPLTISKNTDRQDGGDGRPVPTTLKQPDFLLRLAKEMSASGTGTDRLQASQLLLRSCASELLLTPKYALARLSPGSFLARAVEQAQNNLPADHPLRLHFSKVFQHAQRAVAVVS